MELPFGHRVWLRTWRIFNYIMSIFFFFFFFFLIFFFFFFFFFIFEFLE